jgi:sarcosine oxidase
MQTYDAIVVGLGAVGSAALYQLSLRGTNVLGIDRFSPPHDQGSSHGDTRITRLAIGEGAHFTPLVKRSHEIWRTIENETGADLLTQCGGLILSSPNRTSSVHVEGFFDNTVEAARRHGVAHELLNADKIRARFPLFNIRNDEHGFYEAEAGFVRPEAAIAAQLSLAEKRGAEIRRNETVLGLEETASGVSVTTDRETYRADKLIVAAGPWLPKLLGGPFESLLRIYRQVVFWFDAESDAQAYTPARFPVFIWELADWPQGIYGIPDVDGAGLKVATEYYASTTSPDAVDRVVSRADIATMVDRLVAPNIRGVSVQSPRTKTCLYTVTPDAGFLIDRLPQSERIVVASCCSGHGFKHSAALGEVLADMAQGREPAFDIAPFRLARFG